MSIRLGKKSQKYQLLDDFHFHLCHSETVAERSLNARHDTIHVAPRRPTPRDAQRDFQEGHRMSFRRINLALISLCVLAALSIGTSSNAATIVEETFTEYLDDALISDSPAGPATGLTGDWTLVPNDDFYVNRTQLDLDVGIGEAVYDRVSTDNGTREATRSTSADHVLLENHGDAFYTSFLIDPGLANGHMTFELDLVRLDGGGVSNFSFGIIGGQYIVGNGGIDVDASGGTVTLDQQRVVARVVYGDADSGPDDFEVVTLWVDPVDESSTPVINEVLTDFLNRGGARVSAISIRGEQMLGQPAFFDDLRVGDSFVSVPEPSASWLGAVALTTILLVCRWRSVFSRGTAARPTPARVDTSPRSGPAPTAA